MSTQVTETVEPANQIDVEKPRKDENVEEQSEQKVSVNGTSEETEPEQKAIAKVEENRGEKLDEKTVVEELKEEQQTQETKTSSTQEVNISIEEKSKSDGEKEETTEDDDDAEDDEDESDEELPPGLLERPIEILKEKRERKKTARFTYDDVPTPTSDKKKFEISEGRGIKLGQHPRVEWQLQRNKTEDLKIIHKLFFGIFGDAFSCKKNMRNFSGFPFDKDSPEFEKREDYVGRFTMDNLKWALTVCDVQNRKGKKEELIETFLEWCLCPKPSGKDVPEKKKRKEKPKKKKRKSKSRKSTEKANDSSITTDDVSDDSSEDEETPKKAKQVKKSPKPKTPKSVERSPRKRKATGSPKKVAKVKIGSPKTNDDESEDSDSTPLQKKGKKPPTNAQIKKAVASILKDANLEVITMKAVCMKVYSLYPDFDLSDKKPFIKETVKSIIS